MKTTSYKIKMKDGTEREVTGVVIGDYGIDKRMSQKVTYNAQGEEKVSQSSDYFLTHIPTGMLLTSARTRKALLEIANRSNMIDQTDFTTMLKEIVDYWNSRGWKD